MRTLSAELAAHLAGNAFLLADLYEIEIGGTTHRITSLDRDVTGVEPASAATYSSGQMLSRDRVRQSSGLAVDDLQITIAHGGQGAIGGKSWVRRALDGDLDAAPVRLYRAYLNPTTYAVVGCVALFAGEISDVEPGSTELRLVVASPASRFEERFPKLVVQPSCIWDFGSSECGYAGTLDFAATLATGSTSTVLKIADLPAGLPGSSPGVHQFAFGAAFLGGLRRSITTDVAAVTGGYTLRVTPPFPAGTAEALIGTTDALSLRLGCNKTPGVCDSAAWGYQRITSILAVPYGPASKEAA